MREVDAVPVDPPTDHADVGLRPVRRRRTRRPVAPRAPADTAPDPNDLPGPVRLAEPPQAGRSDHRRADRVARTRQRPRRRQARPGPARSGRTTTRAPRPLSPRVLRRTASAHRHRESPWAATEADHRRRAGVCARRIGAGADRQPAQGPPGGTRPVVPVRRARPRRGSARFRSGRGDVPGLASSRVPPQQPFTSARCTPTPTPCCRQCRYPTRSSTWRGSGSSSRGTCPVPSIRRPAATSTPGARGPPTCATPTIRCFGSSRPATSPRATIHATWTRAGLAGPSGLPAK